MRHIQVVALQGRVRKVHIAGPSGFRLAYFVHEQRLEQPDSEAVTLACPFFLSNQPRSRFDWDDYDWQGACAEVYVSLITGNDAAFIRWSL